MICLLFNSRKIFFMSVDVSYPLESSTTRFHYELFHTMCYTMPPPPRFIKKICKRNKTNCSIQVHLRLYSIPIQYIPSQLVSFQSIPFHFNPVHFIHSIPFQSTLCFTKGLDTVRLGELSAQIAGGFTAHTKIPCTGQYRCI